MPADQEPFGGGEEEEEEGQGEAEEDENKADKEEQKDEMAQYGLDQYDDEDTGEEEVDLITMTTSTYLRTHLRGSHAVVVTTHIHTHTLTLTRNTKLYS